jgi:hypothetical protein
MEFVVRSKVVGANFLASKNYSMSSQNLGTCPGRRPKLARPTPTQKTYLVVNEYEVNNAVITNGYEDEHV